MSGADEIREKLARADRHRRTERAAEMARTHIRLGDKPVARKGLIGFLFPVDRRVVETFFSREETDAIYEALRIVRDDNKRTADELEREVAS